MSIRGKLLSIPIHEMVEGRLHLVAVHNFPINIDGLRGRLAYPDLPMPFCSRFMPQESPHFENGLISALSALT